MSETTEGEGGNGMLTKTESKIVNVHYNGKRKRVFSGRKAVIAGAASKN